MKTIKYRVEHQMFSDPNNGWWHGIGDTFDRLSVARRNLKKIGRGQKAVRILKIVMAETVVN